MSREQAGGTDNVTASGAQTAVRLNRPSFLALVVHDTLDACVELDIALQIKFVRDKMQIPLDFRLPREMLAPIPSIDQVLAEGILIGIAFGIETGARVPIPVPGAAEISAGLEHSRRETQLAEFMESIKAGNSGADYDRIIV